MTVLIVRVVGISLGASWEYTRGGSRCEGMNFPIVSFLRPPASDEQSGHRSLPGAQPYPLSSLANHSVHDDREHPLQ